MAAFAQGLVLIVAPFVALSTFFFLGEVPRMGILMAVTAAACLVYIRPRGASEARPPEAEGEEVDPGAAGIGQVGGPL